jgi:hypothetical protein
METQVWCTNPAPTEIWNILLISVIHTVQCLCGFGSAWQEGSLDAIRIYFAVIIRFSGMMMPMASDFTYGNFACCQRTTMNNDEQRRTSCTGCLESPLYHENILKPTYYCG